ncbi:MAG: CotH kinase family protein [Myxococcales bacterium]|nr:CotH kinase family protein [Myxococcales bacterium]
MIWIWVWGGMSCGDPSTTSSSQSDADFNPAELLPFDVDTLSDDSFVFDKVDSYRDSRLDATNAADVFDVVAVDVVDVTETDPQDVAAASDIATVPETGPWGFLIPKGDVSDILFVKDNPIDVKVELAPADWDTLVAQKRTFMDIILGADCLDHPPEDMFTEFFAKVSVNGLPWMEGTVRRKGFLGSMSTSKPSLLVKLDTVIPDQRLYGLDRLTLNGVRQDPSHLSTCLAYRIFSDAGYPAPRCGFARVTVNGNYLGVYVHVEAVKKPFLRNYFPDDEGNLYEGTLSDFRPEFIGSFEKKTNEKAADFSDINNVMNALKADPSQIESILADHFDVERFYAFWALEVLTHHWDGYAGNTNNFFLYHDPQTELFTLMPWGADSTFMAPTQINPGEPPPASVMATGILPFLLYQSPGGRAAYVTRLLELLDTVFHEDELIQTVETWASAILPHLPEKDVAPATADKGRIIEFIQTKRQAILAELNPVPLPWTKPLRGSICWADAGQVEMNFTTTWGTKGTSGFWEGGSGEVLEYVHQGEPSTYTQVGAVAGWELAAQGGFTAVIGVGGLLPNGDLETITLFTKPALLVPNSSIPFDWNSLQAHRHRWPPPYDQPISMGFVADGVLEITEAGTNKGDKITAKLSAGFWVPL